MSTDFPPQQYDQVRQLLQQSPNLVASQREPQLNQQQQLRKAGQDDADTDPQKRLEATLHLAAALIQQIQQGKAIIENRLSVLPCWPLLVLFMDCYVTVDLCGTIWIKASVLYTFTPEIGFGYFVLLISVLAKQMDLDYTPQILSPVDAFHVLQHINQSVSEANAGSESCEDELASVLASMRTCSILSSVKSSGADEAEIAALGNLRLEFLSWVVAV
ncbi:hypothetical protein SASPL_117282 [Salvia splendens]|uniref:Uncharacterized protein n=1 Tax=Salvia splendens TaxID=180675 RepID=A0A8X8XXN2_SALSN|nr:hypothetical protein SASPL_117282 [Salvia splendens]